MDDVCYAEIDHKALQHNLCIVKNLAASSRIMAMIKGNGYGHGMATVAHHLEKADLFGVARLNEALLLREKGIQKPVLLMEGFTSKEDLSLIDKYQLDFVIHQKQQLEILEQQPLEKMHKVWLKIDTGMHRLGIDPKDFNEFYQRLIACGRVDKSVGLMTHFAKADDRNSDFTPQQMKIFYETIRSNKGPLSLANSAGIIAWPDSHEDWVRPGVMLYGVSPFGEDEGSQWQLIPVMTLKSKIIAIKPLKKGDSIGYGCTWCAEQDMLMGVIAIGYGDGYPRYIQNGAPVLINGHYAKLVGRVSMDMITVDLSLHPQTKIGDTVTLWGKGLPVEEIAKWANTSAYELLCGVTQRVDFITT